MINIDGEKWYQGLGENLRPLAKMSLQLLAREKSQPGQFADYQFIVYPFAKLFEAFLKDLIFQAKLIPERAYNSKKFSIGRSLNPDVRLEQRDEYWFYDDLARWCGEDLAREVWETWLERNRLFHLYPGEVYHLTLVEAEQKVNQIIRTIDKCLFCARENKI